MNKNYFGRTMTEMLGVLAIIGVLSIAVVSGYKTAMLRYRLGETQRWFETVRFIVAEACENGNKNGCKVLDSSAAGYRKIEDYVCTQGGTAICPNKRSQSSYGKGQSPLNESVLLFYLLSKETLAIYLHGLDKQTCQAVIDYDWNALINISNFTKWSPAETVQAGHKTLTQAQKDRLKEACPYPMYMVLRFDLKS